MTKRGLGRGLEMLIPAGEDEPTGLQEVPLHTIVPNPHQPRMPIKETDLAELADSIREHGIIQPLVVTRNDGSYTLIAGERRWRASKLAGLRQVPVIIKEAAPQQMLEMALVENVQRADLHPIEEALAYKQLVDEFGLLPRAVAQRVGKDRSTVVNKMRLLAASQDVQEALMEGDITEGHARPLLALSHEDQDALLQIVISQKLNVRQVEALVQQFGKPKKAKATVAPEVQALEKRFEDALNTRVRLKAGRKGGRVVIYYYNDEEFQALYNRLTGEEL